MLDTLTRVASPSPDLDARELPTFCAATDVQAEWLVARVVDYFGRDRSRTTVRVLLDDGLTRYLGRTDLYRFVESSEKGFGDSGYASVPGFSAPGTAPEFEFRCPRAGCPYSPLYVLAFAAPPTCRVHGIALDLAE